MPPSPAISSPQPDLAELLQRTFGHTAFRANQQAVCEAAAAGKDVLLVMPTGAGKSLCYQLPALARQAAGNHSAALVISPLIALMDDQAAKLTALGLRVARIHSGLDREQSRQACRNYLAGQLDFLFIAPERLRVPGFPEMLARRKPALVAIDEAHCISAWGHDFRPDYRTLGDHLPSLRPAPVIALTATATPTVQQDIVAQLNLRDPALFIHGFRRHNLAIEVVELSKPQRPEFVSKLLQPASARPAIVYAPSRKSAEELAQTLNGALRQTSRTGAPGLASETAAAYHAGLDPATRDRIQRHFLAGTIDVVVATIAFGMGIDKADVRTVVHTALPASVESYYQEIGRAGRDGLPSRTVLLHSFADRKTHEFFLERDYPAATELARIARLLTPDFQNPADLARRLKMDPETLANALGKLASQGAASLDFDGNVRSTGVTNWQKGYDAQLAFRRSQIDRMAAFAESPQCRMLALIQHFGDTSDSSKSCDLCDFCSPTSTSAQSFREPTSQEQRHLRTILRALEANGRSSGKLFTDLALTRDRKEFDGWLDALARAGLLTLTSETFISRSERDSGREITYRKATLTYEGRHLEPGDLAVQLRDTTPAVSSPSRSSRRDRTTRKSSGDHQTDADTAAADQARRVDRKQRQAEKADRTASLTPAQRALEERIRAWRKDEAARLGKPAFIVLSDRTLTDLAVAAPQTLADLRRISGIGPEKSETYGAALIALCRDSPPSETRPPSAVLSRIELAQDPRRLSRAEQRDTPQTRPPASSASSHGMTRPAFRPSTEPVSTLPRPRTPPDAPLTPAQQTLDQRLRDWRATEAARSGLPQFFILPASTLRAIVVEHPRTLTDLRRVEGIGTEKADRHGPDILKICNDRSE